uniref:Transmembrane protein n=1 Tax=Chromera velia CCMP2878 TaxID=1169474 RepID=A0A0G4FVY8_9ALVE|eukprot:Cvel_19043.t1-p1 / transcript=Cvel_19043.t1 / gene=Cvel_19043 / organism=Chromera_velia_CCMP2878 / gene_product=hypothetical protein / transcript_product=hypothetical protein / location=Cvel_scaffold1614:30495-31475(-) / protein_length=327 / sequence_SO=supercontig / SO=protein_coding / is_pseudo=false
MSEGGSLQRQVSFGPSSTKFYEKDKKGFTGSVYGARTVKKISILMGVVLTFVGVVVLRMAFHSDVPRIWTFADTIECRKKNGKPCDSKRLDQRHLDHKKDFQKFLSQSHHMMKRVVAPRDIRPSEVVLFNSLLGDQLRILAGMDRLDTARTREAISTMVDRQKRLMSVTSSLVTSMEDAGFTDFQKREFLDKLQLNLAQLSTGAKPLTRSAMRNQPSPFVSAAEKVAEQLKGLLRDADKRIVVAAINAMSLAPDAEKSTREHVVFWVELVEHITRSVTETVQADQEDIYVMLRLLDEEDEVAFRKAQLSWRHPDHAQSVIVLPAFGK